MGYPKPGLQYIKMGLNLVFTLATNSNDNGMEHQFHLCHLTVVSIRDAPHSMLILPSVYGILLGSVVCLSSVTH